MNYSYIILVIAGLAMAITGFVKNGGSEGRAFLPAILFLAGIVSLTLGILLTCVPDFFQG